MPSLRGRGGEASDDIFATNRAATLPEMFATRINIPGIRGKAGLSGHDQLAFGGGGALDNWHTWAADGPTDSRRWPSSRWTISPGRPLTRP